MTFYGSVVLGFVSDPPTCLASDDFNRRVMVVGAQNADHPDLFVDVGARFSLIFAICFFNACVLTTVGFLQFVFAGKFMPVPFHIASTLSYFVHTVTIITGIVFRYIHSGRVCSGDFLEDGDSQEGYLLWQGLLLSIILYTYVAFCSCGICLGLFGIFMSTS